MFLLLARRRHTCLTFRAFFRPLSLTVCRERQRLLTTSANSNFSHVSNVKKVSNDRQKKSVRVLFNTDKQVKIYFDCFCLIPKCRRHRLGS